MNKHFCSQVNQHRATLSSCSLLQYQHDKPFSFFLEPKHHSLCLPVNIADARHLDSQKISFNNWNKIYICYFNTAYGFSFLTSMIPIFPSVFCSYFSTKAFILSVSSWKENNNSTNRQITLIHSNKKYSLPHTSLVTVKLPAVTKHFFCLLKAIDV